LESEPGLTAPSHQLKAFTDPNWYADVSARLTFHSAEPAEAYRKRIGRVLRTTSIYSSTPDELLDVKGAYFIPKSFCLFDSDGQRIPLSCSRRGPGLSEIFHANIEQIHPPDDCANIPDPLIYLSWLPAHWGHFLTESISRLWARSEQPELSRLRGFFAHLEVLPPPILEFLNALGLDESRFLTSSKPVRLERCFIPAASFSNRAEAYAVHLASSRDVAQVLLGNVPISKSNQPVFLSRSKFKIVRTLRHEAELEERLAAHGVLIVYPETMTLAEQVALFNTHSTFIGCFGSAFHGLAFSRSPRELTTQMLIDGMPNTNFLMFDALLGHDSHYVDVISKTPDQVQVWPRLDLTIDTQSCLAYLRDAGCI
jgi:capsular polysaccharide biosynthesis protein